MSPLAPLWTCNKQLQQLGAHVEGLQQLATLLPHSQHRFPARKDVVNQCLESGLLHHQSGRSLRGEVGDIKAGEEIVEVPVRSRPYGLCGRKATLEEEEVEVIGQLP